MSKVIFILTLLALIDVSIILILCSIRSERESWDKFYSAMNELSTEERIEVLKWWTKND